MATRQVLPQRRSSEISRHLLELADRLKLAFVLDYAEPGFRLTAKDVITLELCLRFTAAQIHEEEMTDGAAH